MDGDAASDDETVYYDSDSDSEADNTGVTSTDFAPE